MRTLKDDVFARRRRSGGFAGRRGVAIFTLAALSLGLLAMSRIDHPAVERSRRFLSEMVSPGLQAIAVPLAPLRRLGRQLVASATAVDGMERLREENQKLKGWEARAKELERRLADLGTLARVVDEPGIEFVTGRVIADAKGPFARSVMLNAGREQGLKGGHPVVSGDGLIGRVLDTGPRSARILLLTDLNSRVPVMIGDSGTRAVMFGDNGTQPKLAHLPENPRFTTGDEVVTSGVGGLFPRGMRIGVVVDDDGTARVKLHARLDELDHVSVLFFETPALDIASEEQRKPSAASTERRSTVRRSASTGSEK